MIQSSIAIGVLIGNFIIVPLSDVKGRRFTFILTYVLFVIGLCLLYTGIYFNLWYILVLSQFINGASYASISVIAVIITR